MSESDWTRELVRRLRLGRRDVSRDRIWDALDWSTGCWFLYGSFGGGKARHHILIWKAIQRLDREIRAWLRSQLPPASWVGAGDIRNAA